MKINLSAGSSINIIFIRLILIGFFHLPIADNIVRSQDQLDIIKGQWLHYSSAPNSLYNYLSDQALALLKERAETVLEIQTKESWVERQKYIKNVLNEIAGPFPDKTPLNARTVKTINKTGYKIEHIIYESMPGFYVTSSLYLPKGLRKRERAPAIIYCSGHSEEGYRSAVYQHVILNLVKKGFIVFAFDPVGQGERLEYFDHLTNKSFIGGPTKEHSYPGAQALINGSSQALYMIWDGIRAVDYLLSRKEVDPLRLGITGRSGGGTQSAYIAAYDERILAAAPENYITNYTRLLESIGPQDAEQNLPNLIALGLDHPDFLIVRAPKPTLIITTTSDMFSIQGAIETEREVTRIYKAFGKPENFNRVEDDAAHASTKKNREAMYAFFQKHLNNPGSSSDEETEIPDPEELQVTETGQVSTSIKTETVFSLNRRQAELNEQRLDKSRSDAEKFNANTITAARELSGYREPVSFEEPVFTGRIHRNDYTIEKYFVKGEGNYIIPFLLFKPDKPSENYLIYLHPSGKAVEASIGGEIEKFVRTGCTVIAPDLLGTGETGPGDLKGDASFEDVSHNIWYLSMLIGRSITGIQAGDVSRIVLFVKRTNNEARISGFARYEMAAVLLHAAAFNSIIESLVLVEPYSSFSSIVMNRFYKHRYILSAVPAALEEYDLPDLASSIAPRKLIISGITDGNGKCDDTSGIEKALKIIKAGYKFSNANDRLIILPENSDETVYKLVDLTKENMLFNK